MAGSLDHNQAVESELPGYVMEAIRCKWCRRVQMEISAETTGVIRWKCKSCRNWNAFEFFSTGKDSGNVTRRMRYIGVEGQDRSPAHR